MMKSIAWFLIVSFLLLCPGASRAGVLLQGFYRDARATDKSWWDHLADEANALRRAGFTAIWIPPVLKGDSGGFSAGYDPYDDYDLGSKDQKGTVSTHWGGREELQRMVAMMCAPMVSMCMWTWC